MIAPRELSRICHFEYLDDDMLRGTVYYGKRNTYKDIKAFLARRPLYRVIKIIKKEFIMLDKLNDFNKFSAWANCKFSEEDRLYGFVQYFEKQYPIFDGYRFLLSSQNIADLYIKTQLNQSKKIDLNNISNEDLFNEMNKGMK